MREILELDVLIAEAHARKEYRPVAVGIVRNKAGDMLLVQSAKNPDEWGWPQGGIDLGERAEKALVREIGEEVSIAPGELTIEKFLLFRDLDAPELRTDKRGFTKGKRYFFFALSYQGNLRLRCDPSEIKSYEWTPLGKFSEKLTTTRLAKRHMLEGVFNLYLRTL